MFKRAGALTHYQSNFRKFNVNQNVFFDEISEHARLLNTHIIFELLDCLTPGFQGHEQHTRLIEMENNSIFSHIRTYFGVLDRDNDNLDHAVHVQQKLLVAKYILKYSRFAESLNIFCCYRYNYNCNFFLLLGLHA